MTLSRATSSSSRARASGSRARLGSSRPRSQRYLATADLLATDIPGRIGDDLMHPETGFRPLEAGVIDGLENLDPAGLKPVFGQFVLAGDAPGQRKEAPGAADNPAFQLAFEQKGQSPGGILESGMLPPGPGHSRGRISLPCGSVRPTTPNETWQVRRPQWLVIPEPGFLHRHRHLIQLEIHTSKPRLGRTGPRKRSVKPVSGVYGSRTSIVEQRADPVRAPSVHRGHRLVPAVDNASVRLARPACPVPGTTERLLVPMQQNGFRDRLDRG